MKKWLWRISGMLAALLVALVLAGVLIVRSDWFRTQVHDRIIAVMEQATGARVEMGRFDFDWRAMQARVDALVLHGKEAPEDAPLLRLERATVGLRILSIMDRAVDLQSLRLDAPEVHVIVYPDGTTNIPGPAKQSTRTWAEELLNLKVREYEVVRGFVEYDGRNTPLNVQGRNLAIHMEYDGSGPRYRGQFSSDGLKIALPEYDALDSTVSAEFVLEQNRVELPRVTWASEGISVEANGALDDVRQPHGSLNVKATAQMRDLVRQFRLPVEPAGQTSFNGAVAVSFENGFGYSARGTVSGQGVQFVRDQVKISDIDFRGRATVWAGGATLSGITAHGLGTTITGNLSLARWRTLNVKGTIEGLEMRRALGLVTTRQAPWNGILAGPFETSLTLGETDLMAHATLAIGPAPEGEPIEGQIDASYDQAVGTIALGSSSVATGGTRVEVEGTLGRTLRVRARTTRLEDVQPLLDLARENQPGVPAELPLRLNNGSITIDGTVTGDLDDPRFHGQVAVVNGQVQEYKIDQFTAEIDASSNEVQASNIAAAQGTTNANGNLTLTKRAGAEFTFSNANVAGQFNLRNVNLEEWAKKAGVTDPIIGTATANVRVSGSVDRPEATAAVDVQNPSFAGENINRLRANIRYVTGTLEVADGIANDGPSEVRFAGTFQYPETDWRNGALTFEASTQNLPSSRIERVATLKPSVSGVLSGNVQGSGDLRAGQFSLTSATAEVNGRQIMVDGQRIGDASLKAETSGSDLTISASGNIRESRVDAKGAWKLGGDSPGSAEIRFSRINVATLQDLVMLDREAPPPTVEGFVEGSVTVNVALEKPNEFRAELRLATVQVNPRENPAPNLGLKPEDVIVRNSQPVVLDLDMQGATVRAAKFVGRNTEMDVAGTIPFRSPSNADLTVRGNIDLVILQLWRNDLQAKGIATVNAAIRGNLQDPAVTGQLTLTDASLYLPDIPNDIDHANGTILFDRRRATIQRLTTETGGGQVAVTGFVEFATPLSYRLQAQARRVRVRYPQDVSTTFNADLSLTGNSEASTLSGTVILSRSAFTVSTDIGQLLAQTSQPTPVEGAENEYLRGMQLDVRIENGSTYQVETSLATNIEADVDLRLRGTPTRPVLSGSISINRGELQLFGNRYTVDRGDIHFLNPVKIEPTFDLNLSTRARATTVNVSFSGTPQRPKMGFSSDPPLQTSEIMALLAVGRDPSSNVNQSLGTASAQSSFMQAGSSLLGQVATAQMSNRVQRFFGATRVKIDPTLTGVDNLPQARLTFEQQISRDITLTYIVNLSRTQEQVVRFQWDFSREWSAVAVRDPNGMFAVDFQFRKRFK